MFDILERLGHFDGIVPSLACILMKQRGIRGGKYLLKTPGNAISEALNFKMSLDVSALKNLCLWWEFQSRLLFIISLLLKNFLTALMIILVIDSLDDVSCSKFQYHSLTQTIFELNQFKMPHGTCDPCSFD